jgi:hypothetical protein
VLECVLRTVFRRWAVGGSRFKGGCKVQNPPFYKKSLNLNNIQNARQFRDYSGLEADRALEAPRRQPHGQVGGRRRERARLGCGGRHRPQALRARLVFMLFFFLLWRLPFVECSAETLSFFFC